MMILSGSLTGARRHAMGGGMLDTAPWPAQADFRTPVAEPVALNSVIVASPTSRGWLVPLVQQTTCIGSHSANHIVIDARYAQPRHAQLRIDGRFVVLDDLSGDAGTYVNGQRVRRLVLADRDLIEIGDCLIRFLSLDQQYISVDAFGAPEPHFPLNQRLQA